MLKIKSPYHLDEVAIVRESIFKELLRQRATEINLNFQINPYLQRLLSLHVKVEEIKQSLLDIEVHLAAFALHEIDIEISKFKNTRIVVPCICSSKSIRHFAQCVYEYCLFNEEYWDGFDMRTINKYKYKEKFFNMQNNNICPYCNIKKDSELETFEIDHLLPSSKYPLLYLFEMNLIPICSTCNSVSRGKGYNTINTYVNLTKIEIGGKIEYTFDMNDGAVKLNSTDKDVMKFIKLIKLPTRYKRDSIKREVLRLVNKIKDDLKANAKSKILLDKQDEHYFLRKEIYKQLKINKTNA